MGKAWGRKVGMQNRFGPCRWVSGNHGPTGAGGNSEGTQAGRKKWQA